MGRVDYYRKILVSGLKDRVSKQDEHRPPNPHDLEQLFNLSLDMLCVAGTDAYFKHVNPAFAKTLGWSPEELYSRPFLDFIHQDDLAETVSEVQKLSQGRDTVYFENRYRCKDGSWKQLAWTCPAPPEGSTYLYAVARDITERKQAEEALRLRDSVFDSMALGLVIADAAAPDMPIIYCNPATVRITGYARDAIVGRNHRFLQNDDHHQLPLREVRSAVSDGRPTRVLLRNYRKNGDLFWNELTLSPVREASGRSTHFVGLQNDITEIVNSEGTRWAKLSQRITTLAPRQKQVLDGLVTGQNIKAVAHDLGISAKTAEMHRQRVLVKMGVRNVVELVRLVLTSAADLSH